MKKLTSLLLAGMLTVSGCACAVTASAAGDDATENLFVILSNAQLKVHLQ